jgi:hypothetical protein
VFKTSYIISIHISYLRISSRPRFIIDKDKEEKNKAISFLVLILFKNTFEITKKK